MSPLPQDPTACLRRRPSSSTLSVPGGTYSHGDRGHRRTGQRSTHEHHIGIHIRSWLWTPKGRQVLLRKEVIQPHLPVRLPCYDFVPIADPTFDNSLPEGLGHWLRVLPTFVT